MPPKVPKGFSKGSSVPSDGSQPLDNLATRRKKGQFVCPICDDVIVDAVGKKSGHESVECNGLCSSWLHRHCAGLSKAAFHEVCKSDQPFFCPQCRLDNQSLEIASLRDLVTALSSKLSAACTKLEALQGPLSASAGSGAAKSQLGSGLASSTSSAPLQQNASPGVTARTRHSNHPSLPPYSTSLILFFLDSRKVGRGPRSICVPAMTLRLRVSYFPG